MSATIITTTTTSSRQTRNSRFKNFLNRHCYIVDFLSAAITIVLCLTILLPRVHESFLPKNGTTLSAGAIEETNNTLPIDQAAEQSNGKITQDGHEHDDQNHDHNHRFPAAELLICIGFFVFYCAGLSVGRPQVTGVDQELFLARQRKQFTTCCTTSRCSGPNNGSGSRRQSAQASHERTAILNFASDQLTNADCLMLINPHHQHHTHAKHGHSHNSSSSQATMRQQRSNYGTTQTIVASQETYNEIGGQDDNIQVTPGPSATIVVDEIRITSGPKRGRDQWPHSLGLLLFSVILALVLVFFDMNVLGMIRAVKVFRATSTGALLYVAFFIMLPLKQNHCNSCEKEEEETYITETSD